MILKIAGALRNMGRKEEGFTLIELLIVIAILAVLAAIAIPLVINRIDEANKSANLANITLLQGAVDMYYYDCRVWPSITATELQKDLLGTSTGLPSSWKGPYIQKVVNPPKGYIAYTLVIDEETEVATVVGGEEG